MQRHPITERFSELRETVLPQVMALLDEILVTASPTSSALVTMCRYHLDTGGKRLRALLPLIVAETLGTDAADLIPFGAACEMLHNATLVHDDLQDGDRQRRGRDTVWEHYGAPRAINLGDAMFYYAVLLLHRLAAPAQARERATKRLLLETLRVIDGQEREFLLKQESAPTLADYFAMVEGKTSGLFALPIAGAAELCDANDVVTGALTESSRHLGVLFQIQDDVLDLYGDKGRASRGSDIAEGKRSALVVYALNHAAPNDARWLRNILDKPREETSASEIADASALFDACGATDFALEEIARRRRDALEPAAYQDHPKLRTLIDGLCDVFLAPIADLVASRGS